MSNLETAICLFDPTAGAQPAPDGLADIWERVSSLLAHWWRFNLDETRIRAQQHGMVRDGCFIMPSPLHDGADTCHRSYYWNHRFFYEFDAGERYYWVSSVLDRAFALSTLYFPKRRLAVTMYDYNLELPVLREFNRFRSGLADTERPAMPSAGRRTAVAGWLHFVHMLWNELPAIDHIAASDLRTQLDLTVTHEPFGPMEELFPEFAGSVHRLRYEDIPAFNATHRFVLGLGAWTITPMVRQRVRNVMLHHAEPGVIASRNVFRARHGPVIWLSVKPPNRTSEEQAALLAALISAVKRNYPRAGFILNGVSRPWDFHENTNYQPWFRESLRRASDASMHIIGDVIEQLPLSLRADLHVLSDVTVVEEFMWGEIADFYFCHGGTMQNKIAWLHNISGMMHSNRRFIAAYQGMPTPVVQAAPCYFLPPDATLDDDEANYSADALARKDQNYRFTSYRRAIDAFLQAFAASQSA